MRKYKKAQMIDMTIDPSETLLQCAQRTLFVNTVNILSDAAMLLFQAN